MPTLAVNLGGWLGWASTAEISQQFEDLQRLVLFDGTKTSDTLLFKGVVIESRIESYEMKRKATNQKYTGPRIRYEDIPGALEWEGELSDWIIYKYPRETRSNAPAVSRRRRDERHLSTRTTSSALILANSHSLKAKKRPADLHNVELTSNTSRKAAKRSHPGNIHNNSSAAIPSAVQKVPASNRPQKLVRRGNDVPEPSQEPSRPLTPV